MLKDGPDQEKHFESKLAHAPRGVKAVPLRFAADCMLGRLARWLRILGHDVVYYRAIDDGDLVRLAVGQRRVILTRDTRLVQRRAARHAILIESPYLEEQLGQMVRVCGPALCAPGLCRRCLECNVPTSSIQKSRVRDRVPPYVYRTQSSFLSCPACHRIYWKASHVRGMILRLHRILGIR